MENKNKLMTQDSIVAKVHAILENAMPGVFSKYRDHIAEIFTQERGKRIVTYRTNNEDVVIFTILDDIIGLEAENTIIEGSADKDTESLHYSEEIRNSGKNIKDEAFAKAGNPYDEWHKQGINFFTLDKIIK